MLTNQSQISGFTPNLQALQCVSGTVTLFQFIIAPTPGTIIGQVQPTFGTPIFLVQSQPTPLGGTPLSSVNGRFAQVCGRFRNISGQTVLDVVVVNPGAPSPTGTPFPNQQLLLLLLLILLLPRLLGTSGFGTTGINPLLQQLLGTSGLGITGVSPLLLQQLLGTSGLGITGVNPLLLQQLLGSLGTSGLGNLASLGNLGSLLGTPGLSNLLSNPNLATLLGNLQGSTIR